MGDDHSIALPSTSHSGLTTDQAATKLQHEGANVLPKPPKTPVWRQLAQQFVHFFAVMLWIAGGLAFVAGLPELGVAIFLVILINGIFAFVQEYRAERAAEQLQAMLPRRVTVRRDGILKEIDAHELVVGDIVLLGSGDRISADMQILESDNLEVDVSALTGESIPQPVDQGQQAFAGTYVVAGEGIALVTATGRTTRLARIAKLTQAEKRPPSPLSKELNRVVRTIATIAVSIGVFFFGVSLVTGMAPTVGFLFAIGVMVALIPEGLLPTVTLSLAVAAKRMASRNGLVRRLESVETLGSATVICTDKTGTLTRNEMAVVEAWTPAGWVYVDGVGYEPTATVEVSDQAHAPIHELARVGARCSTGRAIQKGDRWVAQGDPMEAALEVFARRLNINLDADKQASPTKKRFPFDPHRRRMSIIAGDQLLVKGAPDSVLPRCRTTNSEVDQALTTLAERGLRVLAVATRSTAEIPTDASIDEIESNLEFVGLVGLEDPPREEAREAIEACQEANIQVTMLTGDHPLTARAIAREVGLLGEDGSVVLEGRELPQDDAALGTVLDQEGVVVSRVAPEDKLRITRALQRREHVVAMTGDGVNDGPALQKADIGVAMGRTGTDVAREAADLVLLDDNFATIVAAIEQGRATFSNVRRFLTYHLTDNVAELTPFLVWGVTGGQFPLAIGVLQILAIDIGTDLLPALALGAERPTPRILQRPLGGQHLIDKSILVRVFGVLGFTLATVEMLAFVVSLVVAGWQPGDVFPTGDALFAASGAAFSAIIIGQMANAFACRSTIRWPGALGWTTNELLLGAVTTQLIALIGFLYFEPLARILEQAPPPVAGAVVALLAAPAVLLADALHKRFRARG